MPPHRWQPTRLPRPWDSPGKNTGVGCHFLLQCMKVKTESEVAQSCPTIATPWTAACQAPPSMGFSRQQYWSGVPPPSPNWLYIYMFQSIYLRNAKWKQIMKHHSINTVEQENCKMISINEVKHLRELKPVHKKYLINLIKDTNLKTNQQKCEILKRFTPKWGIRKEYLNTIALYPI